MEFDRSRVYSSVNADELKAGDKVIVADQLSVLKQRVQEGKEDSAIVLQEINGEDWGRRFGFKMSDYALAYLVERKDNCTNCGEGKWDVEHKKILCDPAHCGNGNVVFRNQEIEVCEYWKPIVKMLKTEQKAEPHCRPFTIREAKEYILQNWFDGAEDVEAAIPFDPEYKVMKLVVRVLELAEKICGVEE